MTPEFHDGINWKREPGSYLGILLHYHTHWNAYGSDFALNLRYKTVKWAKNEFCIFARTTVYNVLAAGKLCYVHHLLHGPRVNIQRIHRVFALFIWMWIGESMRPIICFEAWSFGGWGRGGGANAPSFIASSLSIDIPVESGTLFPAYYCSDEAFGYDTQFCCVYCSEWVDKTIWIFQGNHGIFSFFELRFSLKYFSIVSRKPLLRLLRVPFFAKPLYRTFFIEGSWARRFVLCERD